MKKLGFMLMAIALGALPAPAQQKIDEKRPASKDGTVHVYNLSGTVKVTGWDRDEVAVTGTLGRGSERLEFTSEGARTIVKVIIPHKAHHVDGSDLDIKVPAGSALEVETVSADITAQNINGALQLESVSGSANVTGGPSRFDVRTVSGEIGISAVSAPGRAKSVSGNVTLDGVTGNVEAGTVSGDVAVKGGEVSQVELGTTSGDIKFDARLGKGARLTAKSTSGSVSLLFPADVAADVEASSFSGKITNDFGPAASRADDDGPGQRLAFTTGGGGARVIVKSFSGSVHLRKK